MVFIVFGVHVIIFIVTKLLEKKKGNSIVFYTDIQLWIIIQFNVFFHYHHTSLKYSFVPLWNTKLFLRFGR